MRRRWFWVVILASCFGWSCFEIDQEIELKKDLSGSAKIGLKIDFEPMVEVMASMRRGFGGQKGPPSEEEIAAVKKKMLEDQKSKLSKKELGKQKTQLQQQMPKGVELTELKANVRGTRTSYKFHIEFDDMTKLADVRLDPEPEGSVRAKMGGAASGPKNPIERPFENLRVIDEGATLLIESRPANPAAGTKESMPPELADFETGMGKVIKSALASMKVTVKMTAPFEVVESNATRTRGSKLTWSYDLEAFEALSEGEKAKGMWVRLKKPAGASFDHLANLKAASN